MRLSRRGFLGLVGSILAGLVLEGLRLFRVLGQPLPVGWRETQAREMESSLAGRVIDILSGHPILSASVSAVDSISGKVVAATSTSATGDFALSVPDGTYEVKVTSTSYAAMSRVEQRVAGSVKRVDFRMIPLDVDEEGEKRIYEAVVTMPQSPLFDLEAFPDQALPSGIPLAVTVPETIIVDFGNGVERTMTLDYYLKGVVAAEIPSSWHREALRAQAVAARSYAVAYASTHNGRICATTSCQVYTDTRYEATSLAVDDTHNQVAVYNGSIITAFYFSKCNGQTTRDSERALFSCRENGAGFGVVPYCREKVCNQHQRYLSSICGYYGHGVGMCQYGAKARADAGSDYRSIITYYYSSVTVEGGTIPPTQLSPFNGALILTGSSVTLVWSTVPNATGYYAEFTNASTGATQNSGWTSPTSWGVGVLAKGTYNWRVKARVGTSESTFSGYFRLVITDNIYKVFFPRGDKR